MKTPLRVAIHVVKHPVRTAATIVVAAAVATIVNNVTQQSCSGQTTK